MYSKEELIKYPYFERILQLRDISSVVDSLTGLISRSYIIGFIHDLIDNNIPFTLAIVDLDNFKFINDTQGHKVGDGVLARFGLDIKTYLAEYGLAGRYGGDEFLVINFRDLDYDSVWKFYSQLYANNNVLRKNIVLDTCEPFITGTIGSATYPKDAADYDSLFELIDKTLYRGKTKGRNCYIIYVESKHKDIQIKQLARRGLSAIFNDISIRFDAGKSVYEKLENIISILCDDMRINHLYYINLNNIVKAVGRNESFGNIDDIDKVVVNNIYSTNELDEFKYKAPCLYKYCVDNHVFSVLLVRIGTTDETCGYLMCAEPRSRRIWQDDEEAILFFIARTLGGYMKITGESLD